MAHSLNDLRAAHSKQNERSYSRPWQMPIEDADAEEDAQPCECTQQERGPESDLVKIRVDRRRHQKHNVDGVNESLFIDHASRGLFRRDDVTVVCHLDFMGHLRAIRVASVEKNFSRTHPTCIQISHLGLEPAFLQVFRVCPRSQDFMHVQPCRRADTQAQQEANRNMFSL